MSEAKAAIATKNILPDSVLRSVEDELGQVLSESEAAKLSNNIEDVVKQEIVTALSNDD